MHLIAAKMAAAIRVNGDLIGGNCLAELDGLANEDMISALARIVTKGNSATQSLSDAFASANQEFGMADSLIGGYDRQDQAPVTKEAEEGPSGKEPTKEEVRAWPTKEALGPPIMPPSCATQRVRPHQLSLLPEIKLVAHERNSGRARARKSGEDHTLGRSQPLNGHALDALPGNELISPRHAPPPAPPEMDFAKNLPRNKKRRRKYRRNPSLFDALQQKL